MNWRASGSQEVALKPDYVRRLRKLVHKRLIASIEDDGVEALSDTNEVRERISDIVEELKSTSNAKISKSQHKQLEREILEELSGMGPLASLMIDPEVSDILVNGPDEVWTDRRGKLERTDIQFDDDAHLRRFLDRIVSAQGRHLDAGTPMVDAKLPDGSRLHAIIPPLCALGAVVSIRRFREKPVTADELVGQGVLSAPMLDLLKLAVSTGQNVVIAGSAAAGKTTLLNVISGFIPENERVVTVEETAELKLAHAHVIPLESRPTNTEGRGGIGLRDLVRNALRMRADRIIVGEVRGEEVMDMLQAMNVGHDGSLTTVHANSPKDVLRRLEALAHMGDAGLPRESIREMIGSAIQLIVQVMRFRDGSRRVVSICEVLNEADRLETAELYRFQATGTDESGRVQGEHHFTGTPIRFIERAKQLGYEIPDSVTQLKVSHA